MRVSASQLSLCQDVNIVASYLARRDLISLSAPPQTQFDWIVLLGSACISSVRVAAEARLIGWSDRILVSGGVGHSSEYLWQRIEMDPQFRGVAARGRPEAEIFREILLRRFGIPSDAVVCEPVSTNCGENALETRRLLTDMGELAPRLLLIQDPTMQRRTHASFERAWSEAGGANLASWAPCVPELAHSSHLGELVVNPTEWETERFLSLVLGEIPRLHDTPEGYGPNGRDFISHVEVPPQILEAHSRIASTLGKSNRHP